MNEFPDLRVFPYARKSRLTVSGRQKAEAPGAPPSTNAMIARSRSGC